MAYQTGLEFFGVHNIPDLTILASGANYHVRNAIIKDLAGAWPISDMSNAQKIVNWQKKHPGISRLQIIGVLAEKNLRFDDDISSDWLDTPPPLVRVDPNYLISKFLKK